MNLPDDFKRSIENQLGASSELFFEALNAAPQRSIRLNPHKKKNISSLSTVNWCDLGYYLPHDSLVAFDPLFHAGSYYVQEASSMSLDAVIKALPLSDSSHVLDLCASPGGKSTLLSAHFKNGWVVSNETIFNRVPVLVENVKKWGLGNIQVTHADAERWAQSRIQFDLVMVDAPCSGEGMFRKDANACQLWSIDAVNLCAARQRRILANSWEMVKEDGYLIYSTCTFNFVENENNLAWFLSEFDDAESVELSIEQLKKYETRYQSIPAYRFYFHNSNGEGFFISVLRKSGNSKPAKQVKSKVKPISIKSEWIINPESFYKLSFKDKEFLITQNHFELAAWVAESIPVKYAGVEPGEYKNKDFIPSDSLALSVHLKSDTVPLVELEIGDALKFLNKSLTHSSACTTGLNLFAYKGQPLGFAKVLSNRMNSMWPNEWKLRNLPGEHELAQTFFL